MVKNRYTIKITTLLLCLLLALNTLAVLAQEATAEVTAEMTAEATEDAPPATETPVAEITEEVTEEATVEVTEAPTEEATEAPTATPLPTELPDGVFADDFEDGDTAGWEIVGWTVADGVLTSSEAGAIASPAGVDWPHLLLSTQVQVSEGGSLWVELRQGVSVRLHSSGQADLLVEGVVVAQGNAVPATAEGWWQLNLQALGETLTVATEYNLQFSQAVGVSSGALRFVVEAGTVALDEVVINRLDAPSISPTVEPVVEVEVTEEATDTAPVIVQAAPAAPELKTPAADSTVSSVRPKLTWKSVPTAKKYRVDLARDAGFTNVIFTNREVNSTALALNAAALPNELRQGTYYWRVQAANAANEWSGESTVFAFRVGLQRTPKDNTFSTNTRVPLTWSKAPAGQRYRLLIDNDSNFSSPIRTIITTSNNVTKYAPPASDPLPTGNLFWRVDVDYNGSWEVSPVVFALTITPKPLNPPLLNNPANNSFTNDTTPELVWTTVADPGGQAVSYELVVSTRSNFRELVYSTTTANFSLSLPSPLAQGRYYWRVRTLNALGAPGKWSKTFNFTLDTEAPLPPVLTAPRNGFSTATAIVTFKWKKVSKDSQTYAIRWGTTNPPNGASPVDAGNKTSYKLTSALLPTTYYWQVRTTDKAGNVSAWSAPFSLVVASPNNAVPVLNRYDTPNPTFTWTPISWAQAYHLQVSSVANFSSTVYNVNSINASATSHAVANALADGVYYWRIRARNGPDQWGNWSTVGTVLVLD